jgi:hypothetical protein
MSAVDDGRGSAGSPAALPPGAAALPEHVAKLSAANATLTAALQTAHADIAALLAQREELADGLRATEDTLLDVVSSTSSWFVADLDLCRRRADQLRASIAGARDVRARMDAALRRLAGGEGSDEAADGESSGDTDDTDGGRSAASGGDAASGQVSTPRKQSVPAEA